MINCRYAARMLLGILAFTGVAGPAQAQHPAAVRVPAAVLQRYVGEYLHPAGETVTLTVSGDTLFRELKGQRVPFVPLSETLFRVGPVITAEFVSDKAGGMTVILGDGALIEYRLPRKGSRVVPATPPVVVPVRKSVLQRYVGVYEYIPGQMDRTDLWNAVDLRGDTLIQSTKGMPEVVLGPISETRFRVGDTALMVEFVVDDAGVTQVIGSGFQQLLTRRTPKR